VLTTDDDGSNDRLECEPNTAAHALLWGATGLAYSTAAYGNAIYGTPQGNKILLWRFAKAYHYTLYQAIRNNSPLPSWHLPGPYLLQVGFNLGTQGNPTRPTPSD